MTRRIVFLDRDGTVNEEPEDEIVDSVQKVRLLPNTIPALKLLVDNKFRLFIITNQIGISKGRLTIKQFHEINNYILRQLETEGISIEDTFCCPHGHQDNCNCRKPKSGMFEAAKQKYRLNLKGSYVIGDRQSDIQVGKCVGSKTIFVLTGKHLSPETIKPDFIAKDLLDAVKYILSHYSKGH
ncbi:HAD family hydrolase [Candidatus Woesearchaeota archaeon]|nr:HAD family hydrolase [Candidatus Woesearchaeota archaeon]